MGGTSFSYSDYDSRSAYRSATGTSAFAYDADIKAGRTAATCHDKMDPYGVKLRESRDSVEHPVSVPILLGMDLTGSMGGVPRIFQENLKNLMNQFLSDKASGKRYLGEGYPAICIAGFDDYNALGGKKGTVQVGQFESGLEIDDDLGRLWLTGHGGGTNQESYELMMYFAARHTAHDHWDKRGKKGFMFLFGDEEAYDNVNSDQVAKIFGDDIGTSQSGRRRGIPVKDMVREVKERYHLFFVIPNLTSNYSSPELRSYWQELIGAENVLMLDDPKKICELIVGTVALFEEEADLDDLRTDGIANGLQALVPLSKKAGGGVSKYSADNLPAVGASSGGTERL